MLNAGLVADALLPAWSVAVPLTPGLGPSAETTWSGGHTPIPDPASLHVKCAVTVPPTEPSAFGAGLSATVTPGAVLSSFTVTLVVAEFPALSVAVPVTAWPAVSVLIVTGAVQVATPEPASAHVNVTVTLLLFQPLPFGAGLTAATIVGGVVSTRPAGANASIVSDFPGVPRSWTASVLAPALSAINRSSVWGCARSPSCSPF